MSHPRKSWRAARVAGIIAGEPRIGPRTVHFDLANACNTRCTTCWHHSPHLVAERVPSATWKRQSLSRARFVKVLDDLATLGGLESIILSGMGDPTLNDELYDMVADAHARHLGVTIITNLLRLDIERLFRAAPSWTETPLDLLTSICGVTETSWQAFHAHPSPRGFTTLLAQLDRLAARGFRPKHVQVINRDNFHELPAMVDFAHRHAAKRVSFKLASLGHGTEAVALTRDQQRHLAEALVPAARRQADALALDTDLAEFARQIHPGSARTAPIEDVGCFMGFDYARIAVDGEVLYCCNVETPVGHLDPDGGGFATLWAGQRWQERRDAVRAGRYFVGCDQCGKFKQNVTWHQHLATRLPPEALAELIGRPAQRDSNDSESRP